MYLKIMNFYMVDLQKAVERKLSVRDSELDKVSRRTYAHIYLFKINDMLSEKSELRGILHQERLRSFILHISSR